MQSVPLSHGRACVKESNQASTFWGKLTSSSGT